MRNQTTCAVIAILVANASSSAVATNADRRPEIIWSMGDDRPVRLENGPLFSKVSNAFDEAMKPGAAGFIRSLAKNPTLQLSSDRGHGVQSIPFMVEVIRAAKQSCLGPFSVDEGATWVQLSWICRTDLAAPISKFTLFRNSPELGVTVWLENGLIKTIGASEPIYLTGRRYVAMDAYEHMKDKP